MESSVVDVILHRLDCLAMAFLRGCSSSCLPRGFQLEFLGLLLLAGMWFDLWLLCKVGTLILKGYFQHLKLGPQ